MTRTQISNLSTYNLVRMAGRPLRKHNATETLAAKIELANRRASTRKGR